MEHTRFLILTRNTSVTYCSLRIERQARKIAECTSYRYTLTPSILLSFSSWGRMDWTKIGQQRYRLDSECRHLSTDLSSCAPGFYRGGHTATSDSACLPCLYNDTLFNRQSLHQARTPGAEYNNAYNCGVTCLGHSRWRDAQRQFLGCVNCEVVNVLFKVFEDTAALSCQFSCRAGYERVPLTDDSED